MSVRDVSTATVKQWIQEQTNIVAWFPFKSRGETMVFQINKFNEVITDELGMLEIQEAIKELIDVGKNELSK